MAQPDHAHIGLEHWQVENALGELFWAEPQLAPRRRVRPRRGRQTGEAAAAQRPGWATRVIRAHRDYFYLTAKEAPRLRTSALV